MNVELAKTASKHTAKLQKIFEITKYFSIFFEKNLHNRIKIIIFALKIQIINKFNFMNIKRFIKVTPQGETKYIVLTAQNARFYLNQGAKVEQPTEEEILEFFPELKRKQTNDTDKLRIEELENELKKSNDEIARLQEKLKRKTKDIE